MAFYSTFLFSDPAEIELLVGKIVTESHLIEKWVVVEGAFSFKGEFKGLRLAALIENDARLTDYREKIVLIEISDNLKRNISIIERFRTKLEIVIHKLLGKNTAYLERSKIEKVFFDVEKRSRDAALNKILSIATPTDWLFITDVDEIVNLSSTIVRRQIEEATSNGAKFLQIQRRRYVFDFDNLDPRFRTVPLIQIELLMGEKKFNISDFRFMNNGYTVLMDVPPVIEFSYCFNFVDIKKKLQDFAHVAPSDKAILDAFKYNHHLRYDDDSDLLYFWFATDLNLGKYIPAYFLDNLNVLKTNSINPEFKLARMRDFEQFFKVEV